jgi:hypothetical protein
MNVLSPLLAQNNLVIVPRYSERLQVERVSQKGGALFYTTVRGEFDFVAKDGTKVTAITYGEAMDSGDKSTNKAMSAALKYACFQTFCIPVDGSDDADTQTHEVAYKSIPSAEWDKCTDEEKAFLQGIADAVIEKFETSGATECAAFLAQQNLDQDEKIALWSRFDSKLRAAIKKEKTNG